MNKNRGRVQKTGTCRRTKKKFVRFSSGLIALMFLISTVSTGLAFGHRVLGSSLLVPAGGENGLIISCADVTEGNAVSPRIEKNISGQSVTLTYKGQYELSYSTSVPVKAGAYTVCGVTPATDTYPSYTATANFRIIAAAPVQTADSTTAAAAAQTADSTTADTAAQTADSTAADTAAQTADSTAADTAAQTADGTTADAAAQTADSTVADTAAQTADSTTAGTTAEAADSTAADTTAQTTDSAVQDAADASGTTSSEGTNVQAPAGAAEAEQNSALPAATTIVFPESLEMEQAAALSTLPITNCSGDGVFTWADASFVPTEEETACDVIFIPNDSVSYDYTAVKGWDAQKQTVTQPVTVRITGSDETSLAKEEAAGNEKDTAVLDDEAIAAMEKLLKNEDGSASVNFFDKNSGMADVMKQQKDGKLDAEAVSGTELSENDKMSSKKQENLSEAAAVSGRDDAKADDKKEQEPVDGTDYAVAEAARMIDELPAEVAEDSEVSKVVEAAKAYNLLTGEQQLALSDQTVAKLVAAQQAAAIYNHSSQGVTVSGDAVKWYIQLRVQTQNDTSAFETPNIDTLIAPYELTLWNLLTDTEYDLPEGARVTISMPTPNVEEYNHLVIVHYRDAGETEYITPTVEGDTLTFETDSFSPFDIAGSKVLVGGSAIAQNYSSTTNTLSSSTGSTGSTSGSNAGSSTGLNSSTGSGYGTGGSSSSGSSYQTGTYSAVTTTTAVWTGDDVDISIYLIIGGMSFVMAMGMMGYNIHQNLMIKRRAKTKAWRNGIHE